jgi:hypothetical protein
MLDEVLVNKRAAEERAREAEQRIATLEQRLREVEAENARLKGGKA